MNDTTPTIPDAAAFRAAASALEKYSIRTPLLPLHGQDGDVHLKLENLQAIGAYKVRSIGNALLGTDPADLARGVYTASSGNSGLALAWMARQLGIPARVYATEGSPAAKLDAIRHQGAEVCFMADDDWWQVIEQRGHPDDPGRYVDAVRDPLALAGNATIGLEIVEQMPDVDTVILPFGGGAGAIPVAAALAGNRSLGKTVCVVTGGSIDADMLAAILREEP